MTISLYGAAPSQRSARSPAWPVVVRGAAAMAVSMGIGRFAYTPILPLMHAQAGLSAQGGSLLATANYIGYLIGALAGIVVPALVRSALTLRTGLVVVVATVALMALTRSPAVWFALRLAAGVASALVFMITASAMLAQLREHAQHLVGWGFGGVGVGIALSGAVVLVVRTMGTWRTAWLACGALALALTGMAWMLRTEAKNAPASRQLSGDARGTHRRFAALFTSYALEGVGYIIAGTFLVAAIDSRAAAWVGTTAWVVAGLAAFPAAALWNALARRWSRPALLLAALLIQACGIALPALTGGVACALVSAALFGATFLGIASMALAMGAHLQYPRSVALLTAGYAVGQILGPLIVTPLLSSGYHVALLVAGAIVLAAAVAAAALRAGYPHDPTSPATGPLALPPAH